MYFGDYQKGAVVFLPFNASSAAGGSITLATNGTPKAYINGGIEQITAGLVLVEDHDGITGRHGIQINTAGADFLLGADVDVCLDGAVVDGQTMNVWVGKFSVARSSAISEEVWSVLVSTFTDPATVGGLLAATKTGVDAVSTFLSATLDPKVTGIKAKTDSLTFTVAGVVDSNIQQINDVEIIGNGDTVPFNVI